MSAKRNGAHARNDELTKVVGRALRRSARQARKVARMYGTPVYVVKDGKIVAEKP
jgi:GGDEF domain-containing protein